MNNKIIVGLCVAVLLVCGGIYFLSNKSTPVSQSDTNTPVAVSPTDTVTSTNTTAPVATITQSSSQKTFSITDVAKHKSALSCWSIINGKVYDLTSWIGQHPGGPQRILSICGSDGSFVFNDQHGGQRRPERELAGFYIGDQRK